MKEWSSLKLSTSMAAEQAARDAVVLAHYQAKARETKALQLAEAEDNARLAAEAAEEKRSSELAAAAELERQRVDLDKGNCFVCSQPGHYAASCPYMHHADPKAAGAKAAAL